jgi:hypothetical protein
MTGLDLLVVASEFVLGARQAFNSEVRDALHAAAAKVAEVGMSRMQEQ